MAGLVPAIHASLPLWGGWRAASAPGGVMICTMRYGYAAFERDTPIPTPPEASSDLPTKGEVWDLVRRHRLTLSFGERTPAPQLP
jgi:hypothetical protein